MFHRSKITKFGRSIPFHTNFKPKVAKNQPKFDYGRYSVEHYYFGIGELFGKNLDIFSTNLMHQFHGSSLRYGMAVIELSFLL